MFIYVFCFVAVIELVMYTSPLWSIRKPLAGFLGIATIVLASYTFGSSYSSILGLLLTLVLCFRLLNLTRILAGRMRSEYLHKAALRSSLVLILISGLILLMRYWWHIPEIPEVVAAVSRLQLGVAILIAASTCVSITLARRMRPANNYSDKELPTVSVCVPARNETEELEMCIQSLLASTYPKLEILVLDDCSSDRTPDIIKGFAHDGVRFIRGDEADQLWLPKNQAYQRLLDEATGEFVLFCGVDTRIAPQTITKLVSATITNKLAMITVLPKRLSGDVTAVVIQPMRYWWELAVPRWLSNRPPALSTCWLASRDFLLKSGGFEAVRRSILPERFFARLAKRLKAYEFMLANESIDVQTVKPLDEQKETAVRVRYPQIHRRPEWVLLLSLFELIFLLGPFVASFGLWIVHDSAFLTSLVAAGVLVVTHVTIVTITNPANVPVAVFNFPIVVLTELYIGYESMLRYEFGTVSWKHRNVCLPVMHVETHLPELLEK